MESLEPTTPSNARRKLALGVVAGLVIVALIAAGVVLIPRLLSTTAGTANITAAAMPAATQIYFSFNPDFDQLPNGDVVSKAWSDPDVRKSIEDDIRDALQDNDLDWDRDLASWLGDEVGLGIGDLSLEGLDSPDPALPSIVLVASTRDVAQSGAFLARWRANLESDGAAFSEQTYRDVPTVEETDFGSELPVAYATLEDVVIVASGSEALRAAIDAILDENGLDRSSNYQTALGQLRGGRAMTAYLDLGAMLKTLIEQAQESGEFSRTPLNQAALDALNALQGMAMGLSFEPNGLLLEMVASIDADRLPAESGAVLTAPGSPNSLLRAVPDSAFLYVGGQIPPGVFDAVFEDRNFADAAEMVERELGIDLREDVFSWLNGEIALIALPGALTGSGAGQIPVGFALLVNAADKQLAEAGAHKLIQAIARQSDNEIEDVTIGDTRLRAMLDFSGNPALLYGLIGDNLVVASSENAAQKIANALDRPLADDDTFKEAIAPLPASNSGYFYLKPKTIVDLVSLGLTFSGQECAPCDLFEPVRAIVFAGEQPPGEAGVGRSVLFFLLDVSEQQ